MQNVSSLESQYPARFRAKDAKELAEHIKHKRSVELVGMKRVGISNFLRFFLYNKKAHSTYFKNNGTLFIPVDLNDLIERDIYPFWLLTFKRVVDAVEDSKLNNKTKRKVSLLFDKAIQTKDLFLTIDGLRKSLMYIVESKRTPIIVFIHFDRMIEAMMSGFYRNLQGLRDATHKDLVYIFTSYRKLSTLCSEIIDENTTSDFYSTFYLRPAEVKDMEIISKSLEKKYNLKLTDRIRKSILSYCNGHVQYLHTCLIALHEYHIAQDPSKEKSLKIIINDERMHLLSDELYASLSKKERHILDDVGKGKDAAAPYLVKTGMIKKEHDHYMIFNIFLNWYVTHKVEKAAQTQEQLHLTNKEHELFEALKKRAGEICDRDFIIEHVWPEFDESGISDWAVDRLVGRLRKKLKNMNSSYTIETIRTRGFRLEEN